MLLHFAVDDVGISVQFWERNEMAWRDLYVDAGERTRDSMFQYSKCYIAESRNDINRNANNFLLWTSIDRNDDTVEAIDASLKVLTHDLVDRDDVFECCF